MARRPAPGEEQSTVLTCADGVNRQLEAMRPNQCYDARNVWERGGKVVQRPGYAGVFASPLTLSITVLYARTQTAVGAFTSPGAGGLLTLNPNVGDRLYLGRATTFDALQVAVPVPSTTSTAFLAEYWNGVTWWPFTVSFLGSPLTTSPASILGPVPRDHQATTVDGQSAYWIRLTNISVGLSAGTQIDVDDASTGVFSMQSPAGFRGLFSTTFGGQRFFYTSKRATSNTFRTHAYVGMPPIGVQASYTSPSVVPYDVGSASIGVVLSAFEVYIGEANSVVVLGVNGGGYGNLATVETAQWAVGVGQTPPAPYDSSLVAQLTAFPKSNLIAFFQNRLWAADTADEPNVVRWGAPYPYHKVWPALAYEYVDQKPTALKPLGENMIVYSQDNIYSMVFDSLDAFNIPHFKALKTVAGRGCVAPNSVQEIDGRHIFLSEDGIYAFNGTPNIEKVTNDRYSGQDRLFDIFPRITASSRQYASSVHWRGQKMYLLSIPVDGSTTNNLTLAWDYARDKWWIWDDIEAQFWLADNGPANDETIYFGDSSGRIFQFNVGDTDHGGAITSYLVTSPVGMRESMHKGLSEIKVLARNNVGQITLSVWPNGNTAQAKTSTASFARYQEAKWGTAVWGTSVFAESTVRFTHSHFNADGSWFLVKVAGAGVTGKPFSLSNLDVRTIPKYEDTF